VRAARVAVTRGGRVVARVTGFARGGSVRIRLPTGVRGGNLRVRTIDGRRPDQDDDVDERQASLRPIRSASSTIIPAGPQT